MLMILMDVRPKPIHVFTMRAPSGHEANGEGDISLQGTGTLENTMSRPPSDLTSRLLLSNGASSTPCQTTVGSLTSEDSRGGDVGLSTATDDGTGDLEPTRTDNIDSTTSSGHVDRTDSEGKEASPTLDAASLATTPTANESRPLTEVPPSLASVEIFMPFEDTQNEGSNGPKPEETAPGVSARQPATVASLIDPCLDEATLRLPRMQPGSHGPRQVPPASDPSHIQNEERERKINMLSRFAVPRVESRRFQRIRAWTRKQKTKVKQSPCYKFIKDWFFFQHPKFYRNRTTPAH